MPQVPPLQGTGGAMCATVCVCGGGGSLRGWRAATPRAVRGPYHDDVPVVDNRELEQGHCQREGNKKSILIRPTLSKPVSSGLSPEILGAVHLNDGVPVCQLGR